MSNSLIFQIFNDPIYGLTTIISLIIGITIHEFSHAFVSFKLGDPTPKNYGRVSLNPLKHLDIIGTILLLLFGFGWGKPVEINPRYYTNKNAELYTALAGPISNFILFVLSLIIIFINNLINGLEHCHGNIFGIIFFYFGIANLILAIFNMIPFPPLDGFTLVKRYYPNFANKIEGMGNIISIIFMIFFITGIFGYVVSPLIIFMMNTGCGLI